MMHTPTSTEILAAEARLAQSKRHARESLGRARVAFRATLARPSTVAIALGAAGIVGFWFFRRTAQPKMQAPTGAKLAVGASAALLVKSYGKRYAMKAFRFFLQQFRVASQERAAQDGFERAHATAAQSSRNGSGHDQRTGAG